jgi:hypothetical protein
MYAFFLAFFRMNGCFLFDGKGKCIIFAENLVKLTLIILIMIINQPIQALKVFYMGTKSGAWKLVKSILKVSGKFCPEGEVRKFGNFSYNTNIRALQWKNEKEEFLTCQESKVLLLLLDNKGQLVLRSLLLSFYWQSKTTVCASRCLDVIMHRLRWKLRRDSRVVISTIRGEGFILTVQN